MSITIRKATLEDAEVLAHLGAVTFYDTFHSFHSEQDMQAYIKKAYDVDLIKGNLGNEQVQYFLAFEDSTPVGYSKLVKNVSNEKLPPSGNIELEKIYVLAGYLDKKVGRELMLSAIEYSRKNGFQTLFLGVWQENHRAVSFYKKFGFETFTFRSFQLGNTICEYFLMKLELQDAK